MAILSMPWDVCWLDAESWHSLEIGHKDRTSCILFHCSWTGVNYLRMYFIDGMDAIHWCVSPNH